MSWLKSAYISLMENIPLTYVNTFKLQQFICKSQFNSLIFAQKLNFLVHNFDLTVNANWLLKLILTYPEACQEFEKIPIVLMQQSTNFQLKQQLAEGRKQLKQMREFQLSEINYFRQNDFIATKNIRLVNHKKWLQCNLLKTQILKIPCMRQQCLCILDKIFDFYPANMAGILSIHSSFNNLKIPRVISCHKRAGIIARTNLSSIYSERSFVEHFRQQINIILDLYVILEKQILEYIKILKFSSIQLQDNQLLIAFERVQIELNRTGWINLITP